jgi:alkanesulfonate monooxygenase SsuD/methylene tetrahydromethanopterin reductase-like flavin-dependent oxidoreductase (luciferase family)
MFAYLAPVTERIQFTTGILILPQRPTALVARQAADVDLLSGGRLRLGVGIGWNYVEYEALGQDFRTRGARQEEQIELLRRLFTEPVVAFSGRFDWIDRASLVPKPTRPIPIWLGGDAWRAGGGAHVSVVTMGLAWARSTATSTTWPRWQTHSSCGDRRQRSVWPGLAVVVGVPGDLIAAFSPGPGAASG